MRVFVLLGPPGSGKGTQGRLLVKAFGGGATLLGMGELFRKEISQGTKVGQSLKAIISGGGLVDSDLTMKVLQKNWPHHHDTVILDGIPRNMEQVEALGNMLSLMDQVSLQRVFSFHADPHALVHRMTHRLSCIYCGVPSSATIEAEALVDGCIGPEGHTFSRRADDFSDIIRHRLKLHEENAREILHHYGHILVEIDGNANVEETHATLWHHCNT